MFVLVPPEVPKDLLIGPVLHDIAADVGRHNQQVGTTRRIRLRVAVHAGEIHHDEHSVVGVALNHAFRLLNADAVKSALRASTASVVVVASEWFFEEVIRHSPQAEPDAYRRIRVEAKETKAAAWVYLPDAPLPPDADITTNPLETTPPELVTPRQLPAAVRDFVGRAEELDALTRLLKDPRSESATMVISAITGTAGVGKTALAVRWAHQVRDQFLNGDLYLNLHSYGPGTPVTAGQALETMLRALGVPAEKIPTGLDAKAATYRSLLNGRRVLVVLDNAADADQVRPLLPGTSGCVAVVTSRSRLSGLVARDGAHPVGIDFLTDAEAVTLLRQIIGTARVDNDPAATAEITRHCTLLPLALRIAAERIAARPWVTLAEAAADLADEHRRLDLLDTDDPNTAVRTAFSWSYRALPADLARVFRLLGLHPGPEIGLEVAAALIDTDPATSRRLLDRLAGMHLLEETAHDRYRFHDLLRSYAAEAARTEETDHDRATALRRMLGWYLRAADDAKRLVFPQPVDLIQPIAHLPYWPPSFTTPSEAVDWYESERVNIIAAVHHAAAAGHHDLAWRLSFACYAFFAWRKHWADWLSTHEIGLASARLVGDRDGESFLLGALGLAYNDLGRFEESIAFLQTALGIARETGHRFAEGAALHLLGRNFRNLGRFEDSIDYCRQALIIHREIGDRIDECLVLLELGYACGGLRRFEEAIGHFHNALAIAEATDKHNEGWAHYSLGYAYRHLGRFEEAIHHSHIALSVLREIGDWWGQGETLYTSGRAQHHAGRHDDARQSLTQALTIFEDLRTPRTAAVRAYMKTLSDDPAD